MRVTDKTELIILGDGARWITKLAKTQYPKATLVLDWWRLKQRVWERVDHLKQEMLKALPARKWGKHLTSLLWRGKAKAALKAILKLCKRLGIDLTFHQNQKRLGESSLPVLFHYIWHNQSAIIDDQAKRDNGYFISSVFAEKAIDVVVCLRQKLRGQNWSRSGAENVLILRQLILHGDFG